MTLYIGTLEFLCNTGSGRGKTCREKLTDLDFDQFLDSIYDPNMFVPVGAFPHNCHVAGPHPTVAESFLACCFVV